MSDTSGRFVFGVILAALMSTLSFFVAAIGLFGAILGSTVDASGALERWGIQVAPEAARAIINWGFAVFLVLIVWVFALLLMYFYKVLPGQERSPAFNVRMICGIAGFGLIAFGIVSIAGLRVLALLVPWLAMFVGVALFLIAFLPMRVWNAVRRDIVSSLGVIGEVATELTFPMTEDNPLSSWELSGKSQTKNVCDLSKK